MLLSEVFSALAYGELSQVVQGQHTDGEIDEDRYPELISHINLGLMALYKRFPLKEEEIKVALQSGMLTYPLTTAYAVSNTESAQPVKFIIDTVGAPFKDDILKIERVYVDSGRELGLNDEADCYACLTPSATVLRVPEAIVEKSSTLPDRLHTENLRVVYRAAHPKIDAASVFAPDQVVLELPYSHMEALLLFIASRVHNPIGMTNEFHAGNSYAAKYENECMKLEVFNLRVDQSAGNSRLIRNGWV